MGLFDFLGFTPEQRFARTVIAAIRARGWSKALRYDPQAFSIGVGDSGVMLLDGFLDFRKANPRRRREIIGELADLALLQADPPSFDEVKADLLPVIRKRLHVGDEWLVLPAWEWTAHELTHAPIGDALCAWVAIERGIGMRQIQDEDLERWSCSFDEILAVAVENLRARSAPKFSSDPRGFFIADYRDHYDAARLLLPELLSSLAIRGDPVVIAPGRDTLAVAGSEDPTAIEAMCAQVQSIFDGMKRLLSPEPIVWRDGAWRPFANRACPSANRMAIVGKMLDHKWQAQLLEERVHEAGREAYVPELRMFEGPDGMLTWAPLGFAKCALAPLAEAYVLTSPDSDGVVVRSRVDVEAICGPFATEPNCHPPRLIVDRAPTTEQWKQLRSRPTPSGLETFEASFSA
ncbi:MAG: hypothetical protein ABW042_02585 [Phenylobacterium sp.]